MTSVASTRNEVIMAHIFCVAQQFSAVTVYVLGKKVMEFVDAQIFVYMRLMFVIPIVLLFAWALTRKFASFKAPFKPILFMVLSGIVGIVIAQSVLFAGLNISTATNASIISAPCTPLFTALFSVLRGTDRVGFVSSITGAMLLLQVWNFKFEGTTLGNLFIVGSSLCSAINSLIQKHVLNEGYHPLVVQTYVCVSGALLYTFAYAPFGLFSAHEWILPGQVWIYIAIVGVIATGLPWCLGIIALKHTSPMTTSVYVVLQPLIAGFVGVVIMGEVLTWVQLLGSGLVLLGLVCVNATPILQQVVSLVKARFMGKSQSSKDFVLLESDEDTHIELQSLSEKAVEVSSTEVQYELSRNVETNEFVIEDEEKGEENETLQEERINNHSSIITICDGADEITSPLRKDTIPMATFQPILVA